MLGRQTRRGLHAVDTGIGLGITGQNGAQRGFLFVVMVGTPTGTGQISSAAKPALGRDAVKSRQCER